MSDPIITLAHLARWGACPEARAIFAAHFPEGLPVTEASAHAARAVGLDVGWLEHALPFPALATYRVAIAPELEAYDAATALAWATYDAALGAALVVALRAAWPEIGGEDAD
jgi:hypothetical protein